MSRIFCGWELGNELSHLSHLSELSHHLTKQGHAVTLALRDLSRPHFFFRKQNVPILQAPVWNFPVKLERPVVCLADVLLMKGYLYDTTLRNLVNAWRGLLDLVKPDLVVCEYAPTLLLALWQSDIPKVIMGSGFSELVPGHPMPDWRPGQPADGFVHRQEQLLLPIVNQVLESLDKSPLNHFSDLYGADLTVIKTLPQLDLQQRPTDTNTFYCIPKSNGVRQGAEWTAGSEPKIFAYLSPEHPQWETLIQALKLSNARVFLHCPGDKRQRFQPYTEGRFRLSTDNIDMTTSLKDADLFVGHGSMTSIAQALTSGIPVLTFPIQLEQLLNGQKIQALGAGQCIPQIKSAQEGATIINRLLADRTRKMNADNLAQAAAALPTDQAMALVAQQCAQLISSQHIDV